MILRSCVSATLLLWAWLCAEPVSFERYVRVSNFVTVGRTRVNLQEAAEIVSEGEGKIDETSYWLVNTVTDSFLLYGDDLFINGRMVIGFRPGETYGYKGDALMDAKGTTLRISRDIEKFGPPEVTTFKMGSIRLTVKWHPGPGGGGSEARYADGFALWTDSYLCFKLWNHHLFLWGEALGPIQSEATVNLIAGTVTVDGKPPKELRVARGSE